MKWDDEVMSDEDSEETHFAGHRDWKWKIIAKDIHWDNHGKKYWKLKEYS